MTHDNAPAHRGSGGGDGYEARVHEDVMPLDSPPCREFPLEFSTNVPSGTTLDSPVTTSREAPYDGFVTELMVGFPPGAGGAVGLQFRNAAGEVFFPYNEEDHYVAQDDIQHPYSVCFPVRDGETLVAEFVNTDTSEDHFVNVIPTVRKAPE